MGVISKIYSNNVLCIYFLRTAAISYLYKIHWYSGPTLELIYPFMMYFIQKGIKNI